MNIQHSSRADDWMTPVWVVDKVKAVLGSIDLDPASSPVANQRVNAAQFYTEEDNGLILPWMGTVYCNPPGGKLGNQSKTVLFWQKLLCERNWRHAEDAIFMCFSVEALQTSQGKGTLSIGHFMICIPSKRISFDDPTGQRGGAPSHSNCIAYVPGRVNRSARFRAVFQDVGVVLAGAQIL